MIQIRRQADERSRELRQVFLAHPAGLAADREWTMVFGTATDVVQAGWAGRSTRTCSNPGGGSVGRGPWPSLERQCVAKTFNRVRLSSVMPWQRAAPILRPPDPHGFGGLDAYDATGPAADEASRRVRVMAGATWVVEIGVGRAAGGCAGDRLRRPRPGRRRLRPLLTRDGGRGRPGRADLISASVHAGTCALGPGDLRYRLVQRRYLESPTVWWPTTWPTGRGGRPRRPHTLPDNRA